MPSLPVGMLNFAQLVPNEEIAANAYNIVVSSYVLSEGTREVIDVADLNFEISPIVARKKMVLLNICISQLKSRFMPLAPDELSDPPGSP